MIGTWHEVWGMKYWKEYLGTFKGTIAGLIEKISLLFPDEIVSVSPLTTDKLEKMGFTKPIITIPNGIDFQKIQSVKASKTKSDVIYAGRFLSHKNLNVLIDSIAEVKKTFPNIKCLLIGDGPEKENLSHQIENLNLMKNVILMPFEEEISDLYALMKSSKVFVLPSTREGFGMVVLEANACGLPVITTNHPDNAAKDLIKDNFGRTISLSSTNFSYTICELLNIETSHSYSVNYSDFDWDKLIGKWTSNKSLN
jgi:glycosyltransferase involved in cell wall biosynthesis